MRIKKNPFNLHSVVDFSLPRNLEKHGLGTAVLETNV